MRAIKALLLAAWMCSTPLLAQELPPFCTSPLVEGSNGVSGHLSFDPANPNGAEPVTVTAGRHVFVPAGISANVRDRTIDVYVTGRMDGFTTPRGDACLSASLTPLAAGTYTVNVYSIDTTLANDPPLLFLSQSLTVAGGGRTVHLDQHGITGTWSNLATPGQGVVMEVQPAANGNGAGTLFGGWFTFDVTATGGQRWYTAQGEIGPTDTSSDFGIYQTTGGSLNSNQLPRTDLVGQGHLELNDCSSATFEYSFADGREGAMPLTRLLANVTCGQDGDNGADPHGFQLSGTWSDPDNTKGQGLVIDINPNQEIVFAGWFTYAMDGGLYEGPWTQRWYTLQGNLGPSTSTISDIGIYETTGGVFDSSAPVSTRRVGTAELLFGGCTIGLMDYSFTAGENAGQTGTLRLFRSLPVSPDCSFP